MFSCSTCDYATERKRNLARHNSLVHSEQKPFLCHLCEGAFRKRAQLNAHVNSHTQRKKYRCVEELCEYSCDRPSGLKVHMRTHTGEKPYRCYFVPCNYSSTTSGALKSHIYIHTGERPFTCSSPGCQYSSRTSGNLTRHFRSHTRAARAPLALFRCTFNICRHSCTTFSELKAHLLGHMTRNPHKCPQCHFQFKTRIDVDLHLHDAHKPQEEVSENSGSIPIEVVDSSQVEGATLQLIVRSKMRKDVVGSLLIRRIEGDCFGNETNSPRRILILPTIKVSKPDVAAPKESPVQLKSNGAYFCVMCDQRIKRKHKFEAHLKWHWDDGS